MMHVQLAKLTECPELAMTEGDAKTLAVAAQNVLRHYSIQSTQKTVDWITFGSVVAFMYTPRVVALRRRKRRPGGYQRQSSPDTATPPPGPAQIFEFRPPSGAGPVIDATPGPGPGGIH